MEPEFWRERWRTGQTGWHQATPHPFLTDGTFASVLTPRGAIDPDVPPRVLVPLCGASVDMAWLHAGGFHVVGVDLAPEALHHFLATERLEPRVETADGFEVHRAPGYELYAGDFFEATPELLGPFDAIYDRAALVALPAPLRRRFATTVTALCGPATRVALVAFEYDAARASGPPFPVDDAEIAQLYGPTFRIERLARVDVLDENPRLRERGLATLHETAHALSRAD